jgi:hypothetical protein
MRHAVVFALALPALGCHQVGKPGPQPPMLDEQTERAAAHESAPAAPPISKERRPGVIDRTELVTVLDAAPGIFLQHVDSQPRFRGGRFVGWKLVAFFPGDPRFAGVDLRAGDVVTRVNGNPIERPEQLMQVWQSLRTSNELVVDVEREGKPVTLRWTIAP